MHPHDGRVIADPSKKYGTDDLLTQMHKANQFLSLSPLPSYICNDSIKNPEPEKYKSEYEKHLNSIF